MAGFAIVEWAEEADGVAAYIETLEVSPDRRGQGIGGELLRHLEVSARGAGAQRIWLHVDEKNAPALSMYEARGYRFAGREEDYYRHGRAALVYSKPL